MKKNKIFMLSLFTFVMSLMLVPNVKAEAQEHTVSSFDDLKTKITSANSGDIIKLNGTITATDTLTIDKSLTLDLNGNTYSGSDPGNTNIVILIKGPNVKVTIKDSNGGTGKIQTTDTGTAPIVIAVKEQAELDFEGGTVTNNNFGAKNGTVGIAIYDSSTLVMKGTAKVSMVASAAKTRGIGVNILEGTATIEQGATVETNDDNGSAISIKDDGTLNLNGGTVKSTKSAAISTSMGNNVNVNITSGTVESDNGTGISLSNNNNFTMNGGTLKAGLAQNGANINIGKDATVEGGLTLSNASKANIQGKVQGDTYYNATVSVKSGSKTGSAKLSAKTATQGTKIVLTTTPKAGYRIASIKVVKSDDENVVVAFDEETSSFVMPDFPVSVLVNYEEITYDIDITVPDGITANPSATKVKPGESVTIEFTAKDQYVIESITVNGTEMIDSLEEGKLTISNINENQSIVVKIKSIQVFVHVIEGENEEEYTVELPENYKFTEEDLQDLEDLKVSAKESGFELKFYSDEKLTKEFDFSKNLTDGAHIYMVLTKIQAPKTYDGIATYMITAIISILALVTVTYNYKKRSYNN